MDKMSEVGQKVQTSNYQVSPGDEMYGTVTIVYNTVLHICFWWVFLFVFFLSFLFIFLGLHTQHLEVPRLGIKSEL